MTYAVLADAALAEGDAAAALDACEESLRHAVPQRAILTRSLNPMPQALLTSGELAGARRWADDTAAMAPGWHKMVALMSRTYIALARGEPTRPNGTPTTRWGSPRARMDFYVCPMC